MARYDDEDDDDIDIRRRDRGEPVPNYLVQAILTTLCCCLPFGIVAIVHAAKVNSLAEQGRHSEALAASGEAKKWCWIAFGIGLIVQPIVAVIRLNMEQRGPRF